MKCSNVYNILNKYKVIKCNFNLQKMEIFKKRAALQKLHQKHHGLIFSLG